MGLIQGHAKTGGTGISKSCAPTNTNVNVPSWTNPGNFKSSKIKMLNFVSKRRPYTFMIPRLCFHQTEVFPDNGDTIDTNTDLSASPAGASTTDLVHEDDEHDLLSSTPFGGNIQPKFRVVISSRVWDFLSIIQYVGHSEPPMRDNKGKAIARRSRHVLLTGPQGSGKSTLLMTAATFLTYRVVTNIYRLAGIGDAKMWASSGDPFMFFALEMLVALRHFTQRPANGKESGDALSGGAEEASGNEGAFENDEAEDWAFEEAGFLVEPRALTSLADVKSWIVAIRDKLASLGNAPIVSPTEVQGTTNINSNAAQRPKMIIFIDQAEYLLEHPDCIPSQIVHMLLNLKELETNGPSGLSYFPSLILSVSSSSGSSLEAFPSSPLKDTILGLLNSVMLSYHLPHRADLAAEERITRLLIRRSVGLVQSLRKQPFVQWEKDLLATGELRVWTGGSLGEISRCLSMPLHPDSKHPPISSNRVLTMIQEYARSVSDHVHKVISQAIEKSTDQRSEKRRLLAVILRMALHVPVSEEMMFGIDVRVREQLFLPFQNLNRPCPRQTSEQSLVTIIDPTIQQFWHPREGVVRIEQIPTAISYAVYSALLEDRTFALPGHKGRAGSVVHECAGRQRAITKIHRRAADVDPCRA